MNTANTLFGTRPDAGLPFPHTDKVHITIVRHNLQTSYILNKSSVCMAMDSRWLLSPDSESQTAQYLRQQPTTELATAPRGCGMLVVNFDQAQILSFQGYKDVRLFSLDEFGFYGGASPIWMNWNAIQRDAFDNECMASVVYSRRADPSRTIPVDLPLTARAHKNLAMRFASHAKPEGCKTIGLGFSPPGWSISHVGVPHTELARATVAERVAKTLRKLVHFMDQPTAWKRFAIDY